MELSAKLIDLEQLIDVNKKHETTCKALEKEIADVKEEFTMKVNEYESLLNDITQQSDSNKIEIFQLQQNLAAKTKEYEKLVAESNATNNNTEKLLNEYKDVILERDKEIIKLKNDYEQVNANFNIQQSKIAEGYKKELDERNIRIEQLLKEIECQKQTLQTSKVEFDMLTSQYNVNNDEIKILRDQNEDLKKSINQLTQINNDLKNKISGMELEIGELKRQLESSNERCNELQKIKDKVESEYLNLTGQAMDSNEQFNKLTQHLKDTERELQELKEKHRESINNYGRNEQELKQQLNKIQDQYTIECSELLKNIAEITEKYNIQESKLKENESQMLLLKNQLKEAELNRGEIINENVILQKDIAILRQKEIDLNEDHQNLVKKMQNDIEKYEKEVMQLKTLGESSEVKLREKVDQLIEAQNELNNKLEEAQKHEEALQKIVDDMTLQLNNQKLNFDKEIFQNQSNLSIANDEINVHKSENNRLKELVLEKDNNVKELMLKIGMLEIDLKSNTEVLLEKERQIASVNDELLKVNENKKNIEDKLSDTFKEMTELKQKYETILSNSSMEGSLVKEQQQQLEILQKDISLLKQEKLLIESVCTDVNNELKQLKTDHNNTLKELEDSIKVNSEIKKSLEEKENQIKSQKDKSETGSNRLKQIEQELNQKVQELSNKDNIILEKEQQLNKLKEVYQSTNHETELRLKSLQDENIELNAKYENEIKSLNKTISDFQIQTAQQQQNDDDLTQSKNKISELQRLLEKSENDIKLLTSINEGQKNNYDDLMKQLQSQYDELKKESKMSKNELNQKLSEYEKELIETKNKLNTEMTNQEQLLKKLETSQATIVDLTNQLELLSLQQNTNAEKDDKLEKITLELQALRKSNSEVIAKNDATNNKLNSEIQNKMKELKDKELVIMKLQEELKVITIILYIYINNNKNIGCSVIPDKSGYKGSWSNKVSPLRERVSKAALYGSIWLKRERSDSGAEVLINHKVTSTLRTGTKS